LWQPACISSIAQAMRAQRPRHISKMMQLLDLHQNPTGRRHRIRPLSRIRMLKSWGDGTNPTTSWISSFAMWPTQLQTATERLRKPVTHLPECSQLSSTWSADNGSRKVDDTATKCSRSQPAISSVGVTITTGRSFRSPRSGVIQTRQM